MVAAVLGLTAALAGCGGGASKGDFISKADAACGPGNTTLASVKAPSNLPELAAAATTVASTAEAQASALRRLDAPGDDKATVAALVTALADVGPPARTLQETAAKTDDAATARAANDMKAKADAAAQQATSYGLTACATGVQGSVNTVFEGTRTVLKAAFVARAESLCAAANRKADALGEPASLATLRRYLTSYLPLAENLFKDIKALAVPSGEEATLADMFAKQDAVIAKIKEVQGAAQRGSQAQVDRFFGEAATVGTAANAAFDAYGLRQCGTLSHF